MASNATPLLEACKALREYMDITRSHGLLHRGMDVGDVMVTDENGLLSCSMVIRP